MPESVLPFRDKVAIVTGASRGIGAATAELLATRGAHVVLAARSVEAISALGARIEEAGGTALAVATDIADRSALDELVDTVKKRFGRLDMLVNNAGVLPPAKPIQEFSPAEWDDTLAVNLSAAWYLSCRARELMDGGVIVNVASTAAFYPSIGLGAYCVSKAALAMLTRACALEWARDGIRVVGVVPGKVETETVQPILEYLRKRGRELNPAKRSAMPEEIAGLIAYLVSDEASYIIGSLIAIDGGELIAAGHGG